MKNKITKRKIGCIAIIIGVIVLPLLYSYFYLGAFWDPYSRLADLPVAVVNNDKGAQINGSVRNIGQEMCDKFAEEGSLKFVFVDEDTARKGTTGKDYYAMIVIPADFSSDIASAATTDKHTAAITFSANEQRNYLAGQILNSAVTRIELSIRESVNKELVQQLADKLESVPEQMGELQNGLGQLYNGSTQLSDGSKTLDTGISSLDSGISQLLDGAKQINTKTANIEALTTGTQSLASGAQSVETGAQTLASGAQSVASGAQSAASGAQGVDAGAQTLASGTQSFAAALKSLASGAQTLVAGAQTMNTSITNYTTGVDSLIANAGTTTKFLVYYVTPKAGYEAAYSQLVAGLTSAESQAGIMALSDGSTGLRNGAAALSAGVSEISAGAGKLSAIADQLAAGTTQLAAGTTQLAAGASQVAGGADQLAAGTTQVSDGADQLAAGTVDLPQLKAALQQLSAGLATAKSGAEQLSAGSTKISSGAGELQNGLSTAKTGVDNTITDSNSQLKALDGIADYAAAPVTVESSSIASIPNYGTAFAPYFLSLSLWVGGLMIFIGIYYDPQNKFKILSRDAENRVLRSFIYLLIGFVQAVVLGIVLEVGLGLKVSNQPLYFISCILVSCVFISVIQFLMVFLKDLGKFFAMVLLILQLTSCGGTFPMETLPKMFNVLYPFMPMTYSVGLFKQTISGVKTGDVVFNGGILLALLVGIMTLTVVFSAAKAKKEDRIVESVATEAF